MAPVREVAFELECFEWAEERLEVAGRWKGLGPHRLNRPVLTVETDGGRRKRMRRPPFLAWAAIRAAKQKKARRDPSGRLFAR